jgi:hypothetical protein
MLVTAAMIRSSPTSERGLGVLLGDVPVSTAQSAACLCNGLMLTNGSAAGHKLPACRLWMCFIA